MTRSHYHRSVKMNRVHYYSRAESDAFCLAVVSFAYFMFCIDWNASNWLTPKINSLHMKWFAAACGTQVITSNLCPVQMMMKWSKEMKSQTSEKKNLGGTWGSNALSIFLLLWQKIKILLKHACFFCKNWRLFSQLRFLVSTAINFLI